MTDATVLIVDDEEYVLEELAEAFRDEGYSVITSLEAVKILNGPSLPDVDLLITDLKMPRIDGIQFYAKLRERSKLTAPAILLSGHGAQSNRTEAENAGFSDCFSKPVDLDELLEAVEKLCHK